ncbi:MAG: pentapeptide repeat-containing protein [Alphaproteobacteria bacterium]|nr:pentapeptide repeat-containing protein [Alphaproteobacteria bacterium]
MPNKRPSNEDAVAALRLFGSEERRHHGLPGAPRVRLNLRRALLQQADLSRLHLARVDANGATLTGTDLFNTDLTGAHVTTTNLTRANLTDAILIAADLTNADLTEANLRGADLTRADLTGAQFQRAKGLVQSQLDQAVQHPDGPPPQNLPDGLTWDEEAAKERWRARQKRQDHS